MCGIVACVGKNVGPLAIEGLTRLQYRGYDSYGFAWVNTNDPAIHYRKSLDSLDDLQEFLPECNAIIGHTRWATHGGVTIENCHPHGSTRQTFALVHNGIVENYQSLKKNLKQKQKAGANQQVFLSETDTEVIARLLEEALGEVPGRQKQTIKIKDRHEAACLEAGKTEKSQHRRDALWSVFKKLEGRNTLVVLFDDGVVLGLKQGSPLVVGEGQDKILLGSDVLSFSGEATRCLPIEEGQMVEIVKDRVTIRHESGPLLEIEWEMPENNNQSGSKDGYPHFMLKEIMEQWLTVARQGAHLDGSFFDFAVELRESEKVLVTGAGGAYFTSLQIAWLLREIAGIGAMAVAAYEIETVKPLFKSGDFILAVSQSGETADTIDAVEIAQSWGLRLASLVNMPMSTLARSSEFSFANDSGPEICVLSTKSATSQITFGYLLARAIVGDQNIALAIDGLSSVLSRYLNSATSRKFQSLALLLERKSHLFILGRKMFHGTAQVGALNIKEASYVHAEAFAAGELKHGVIALIEAGVPVILFVERNDRYMVNVASEVKSRGAWVIGVGYENNELFDYFISLPDLEDPYLASVSAMIPCQLLAYHLAIRMGVNPDKPRNLAKSVTVQ